MTKAICRDWREGESFPYIELNDTESVHYWPCDDTEYMCFQPDYWDNEEFNVILIFRDRPIRVIGIDFDFIEDTTSKE